MSVTNADEARAWLRAWGGKPRRGILLAVLEGVEMSAALSRGIEAEKKRAAAQVLRAAVR